MTFFFFIFLAGKDNHDESAFTGGSTKSDGSSEEVAYTDCKLPVVICCIKQKI